MKSSLPRKLSALLVVHVEWSQAKQRLAIRRARHVVLPASQGSVGLMRRRLTLTLERPPWRIAAASCIAGFKTDLPSSGRAIGVF